MNTLTFKPKYYTVIVREDSFDNHKEPYFYNNTTFTNKREAVKEYKKQLNKITQRDADQRCDYKIVELTAWCKDMYDCEILEEFMHKFDYSADYGKLVIDYRHVGKGMGYAHEFIGLSFLNKHNEVYLGLNDDKRFSKWSMILDLIKEDFEDLNEDEAIQLIKDEARLKLQNSISLDGISNEINLLVLEEESENP